MVRIAFAIAGSEATGGAGAQTDLKTFHKLDTFGAVALTCIVSLDPTDNWNHRFVPIEPEVIRQQIDAITAVHDPDTVKLGMLGTVPTIDAVAEKLGEREWKNVVVDPVLICKGQEPGAALDTDNALKAKILPFATVVTPNVFEAGQLSGVEITDVESLKEAAKVIHERLGVPYVVAKGGAVLEGDDAVDVLYDGVEFIEFREPKIGERYVSGAGCTLAAAITAELAKGAEIRDAVRVAKDTVTEAIRNRISPPTPFDEVYQR
ncbi:MAG TPA: bifunctional hydroxymethylpyrimidine kinase/phosphomethylpyrimidine kinase [Actinomycetaceae bacterium]|nr:bifunctional hydroxymethylpyrimidine kinase/phosphomethylpyrimidine kinase [Actinomycetaceae bacterium]